MCVRVRPRARASTTAASEQQLWRKGGYIWAWPLCACVLMEVRKRQANCKKRASESECSRKGAISRGAEKKSEQEAPCVCGRSPAIWTLPPPNPPRPPHPPFSSTLLFLPSPLPTGVLFMADPFHLSVCYARSPQYMLMR